MTRTSSFLGLRTAIYTVDPVEQARRWYADVLGVEPYFDQPFYVGFNVGGFELGLMPAEGDAKSGPGGVVAYWGVASAEESWARLLDKGAEAAVPVQDVGGGIKTGVVKDPFGNLLGIIENPHFPNRQ